MPTATALASAGIEQSDRTLGRADVPTPPKASSSVKARDSANPKG